MTSNKWKIGHTFGASRAMSMQLVIQMLQHQVFIPVPYLQDQSIPGKLNKILANVVDFGVNTVSNY